MMWCMRWYLPLVLLPIPIAPPYFLLLFLFSTTVYARPCFYCMLLLSAMFVSTCYWPPVPIDTPLARPWSDNVTTFADALHLVMPDVPAEKIPSSIPMADRCWCDFSRGFFLPINTTRWEEVSVKRLRDSIEREIVLEKREVEKKACENSAEEGQEQSACDIVDEQLSLPVPSAPIAEKPTILEMVWILTRHVLFRRRKSSINATVDATPTPDEEEEEYLPEQILILDEETQEYVLRDAPPPTPPPKPTQGMLPWFPYEYDLRKFGFGMTLDFGWPDSAL